MVARGAGVEIAFNASGGATDWIMVLPAGNYGVLTTVDGRGPYRVSDPAGLARESLQAAGGRMPIDENHATDLAAPQGRPAPARGWATQLEARDDGVYAHVEWSAPGAALMSERAYRFISPVFVHDRAGNVTALLRASLTNTPNLHGMAALHTQESDMDLLARLRQLLGLAADADEAAVVAKVTALNKGEDSEKSAAALQAALAPIAMAAGLKDAADATAIAAAVTTLVAGTSVAESETIKALQSELGAVTTRLNALQSSAATDKATAYVDGEIARGRVGVKPLRDHYITMHAADPARVEKEIGALPLLGASGALQVSPEPKDGQISLNAEQKNAARVLGISEAEYAKTLASEAA